MWHVNKWMQQIASDFVTQKRISTAMYGSLVACYLDLFSMYSRTNVSIYMYTCTQTLFQIWIDMGPDVQLPHGVAQPRQNSSKFLTSYTTSSDCLYLPRSGPNASANGMCNRFCLATLPVRWVRILDGRCWGWRLRKEGWRKPKGNSTGSKLADFRTTQTATNPKVSTLLIGTISVPSFFFRWDEMGSFFTMTTADFEKHVSPKAWKSPIHVSLAQSVQVVIRGAYSGRSQIWTPPRKKEMVG